MFQQNKTSIIKDVTLTLPGSNLTFFFTVDSSLVCIGCVLIQLNPNGKLDTFFPEIPELLLLLNKNAVLPTVKKSET